MHNLFLIILFVSLIGLIIGIIHPALVLFFMPQEEKNKKNVLLVFGLTCIISFVLFAISLPTKSNHSIKASSGENLEQKVPDKVEEMDPQIIDASHEPDLLEPPKTFEEPKALNEPKQKKDVAENPNETLSQKNAVRMAKEYLTHYASSRDALIRDLEYQGFDNEDAIYAVNIMNVDWKEQAVAIAKGYLDCSAFSEDGLIEQLEHEGFNNEEATYGVKQININWQEQAIAAAKESLEYSAYSKDGLIERLGHKSFSNTDAVYAVSKLDVNWKEQAVRYAKDCLSYSPYSKSGLIDLLEYSGFSNADAVYAVEQVGF